MSRRARLEQPSRLGAALGAGIVAVLAAAAGAQAQPSDGPSPGRIVIAQSGQLPPPTGGQPPQGSAGAPKKQTAPAKQAAPSGGSGPSAEPKASEAGLKSRVDQLEEQMVDLQVTIGTLESIAKTAGTQSSSATFRAPAAGGSGGGGDAARVDALETQIRALVSQVEQLADRVRAMEGGGGRAAAPQPAPSTAVAGFGRTTVSPARDGIGQLIQDDGSQGQGRQVAAAEPAGAGAKQMYEQAYGYLLQQDYAAAETSFSGLLARFPNDPLAGNAQYWLGETYFYRGQFKPAAAAFLKGYQTYSRSPKAPDSLLKLAMSLDRLGQKDAACASFLELNSRFPNAAPDVKSRASSERQRLGCP